MPFTAPENPGPVRAKFYVSGINLQQWGTTIKMQPVTRGEDNKEWSAATPSGELTMTVANEKAADQFAPGQEWFLTFTPVPPAQVGQEGMAEVNDG